jgi:hypothetical protein
LCVLPALFERLQETVFDFWGDVAVGLYEPVGQVLTEASSLRDLRNTVSDQPGFVTVPQPVKRQAGPHGLGAFPEIAVDGGAEYASVEGAAPEPVAQWAGEYELAGCGREVFAQLGDQEWRQSNCPGGGPGFWVDPATGDGRIRAVFPDLGR